MDGVLIHSTRMHMKAWEDYLAPFGLDAGYVNTHMLGKRNDQIVGVMFGEHLSGEEVAAHGAAKERLYRELMAPVFDDHLVKGVQEFIRRAHEQGIPCALGTNAEPANVDFVLESAGLGGLLPVRVDGHQVEHPKPHPDIYLTAAQRLGVSPANCIVFEDSPGGMQAARAAGMHLVALLTTLAEAPEADLAIPDFLDTRLLPWLSSLTLR